MLRGLQAPPSLLFLPQVATHARTLLCLIRDKLGVDIDSSGIGHWFPVLEWMAQATEARASTPLHSKASQSRKNDYNPLRGHCATSHPLYTLLLQRPFAAARSESLALVQGYLLFFHAQHAHEFCSIDDYERHLLTGHVVKTSPSPPYESWLAIQYLASERSGADTFLTTLSLELIQKDFVSALHSFAVPESGDAIRRRKELCAFFDSFGKSSTRAITRGQRAANDGAPVTSKQAPKAGNRNHNHSYSRMAPGHTRTTRHTPRPPQAKRRKCAEEDIPWDEFVSNLELLLLDEEELHGQKKATAAARAREQLRAIHRPVHLIPSHDRYLSDSDIAPLLKQSLEVVRLSRDPEQLAKNRFPTTVLLVAQCMLFLSRGLDEVSDLHIYGRNTAKPLCDLAICLNENDPGRDCFRVRALKLDYQTPEMPTDGKAYIPSDFVWLPLPPIVSQTARVVVKGINASGRLELPHKICALTSGFKKALNALLKRLDATERLTEGRLSSTLSSRICLTTGGDLALSCLILGQENDLCRAELYYDGVASRQAAAIYKKVTDSIHTSCFSGWVQRQAPIAKFIPDEYVGCRYTPTIAAVQSAVSMLLQKAKEIRPWFGKTLKKDASLLEAHNAYTLYLCWWLGYACGTRAVRSPLLEPHDIDEATGLARWSDKDDASHYHTRFLWVPPDLRKELGRYHEHLHRCQRAFRPTAKWKGKPGYFLDDHAHPIEIGSRTIEAQTKVFFALPSNSHRRFMKQILRGDREHELEPCPPEVIRGAYLGHWVTDQEPWSDLSCLSVRSIRKELSARIPPVLKLLGFRQVTK